MIPETIESTIRTFNFCDYGIHSLHEVDEPEVTWPEDLATAITAAITPEIQKALEDTVKMTLESYTDAVAAFKAKAAK